MHVCFSHRTPGYKTKDAVAFVHAGCSVACGPRTMGRAERPLQRRGSAHREVDALPEALQVRRRQRRREERQTQRFSCVRTLLHIRLIIGCYATWSIFAFRGTETAVKTSKRTAKFSYPCLKRRGKDCRKFQTSLYLLPNLLPISKAASPWPPPVRCRLGRFGT